MPGNLVQAEFFLANGKADALGVVVRDVSKRRAEGWKVRLSVRFLDERNRITPLVREYAKAYLDREKHLTSFGGRWMNKVFKEDILFCASTMHRLREGALQIACEELAGAAKTGYVAIEDATFTPLRIAKPGELHELLESARQACGVWLFVFEPNDLLSEKNKGIAHMIF